MEVGSAGKTLSKRFNASRVGGSINNKMYWKIVLLTLALGKDALGAKILALMVVASHSHHLWNSKYLEGLAGRGHHITYLGVDEYKNPPQNIRHVLVEGTYEFLGGHIDLTSTSDASSYRNVLLLQQWDNLEAGFIVRSDAIRRLGQLIKKEKFDLIIHDVGSGAFLLGAVDAAGRPPVLGITAFGVPAWTLEILGNPMAYASKPYFYSPYSDTMTLLQRANNYFLHLFCSGTRWIYLKRHNEHSKECFGNNVRPLEQILDDMNIIMVNSNDGIDYPFPRVPGLIPVGGLHIEKPKPLPRELKTYLDEAKSGVVYFSLGTNINSSLTKEKIDILLKAFKEIAPVRVLWKLEVDFLPEKPENVKIQNWLPQNDVLAHPNVRLFFTHSGLLSTQEAVYHGKPIVGMPFFLDQHSNLHKCIAKGFGEKLDYNTLTVAKVVSTIRKVLDDPRYSENVKKSSAIFRDQMENPLDRAIYWTEYAVRHKGAPHLRHSSRNLSWYQNLMLDLTLLAVAFAFFTFVLAYKLINVTTSRIRYGDISKLKKN